MGPAPNASPSGEEKTGGDYQLERERRLQIRCKRIERITKENAERAEALRARGADGMSEDELALAILLKLYQRFGQEAVFITVPYGTKARKTPWKQISWDPTQERQYQAELIAAIKRGGNIAVVLGAVSGGLCSIDVDDDYEWICFLAGNTGLQERLQTRGAHGGQVFFRLKPGANHPDSQAVYPIKLKGEQIGEWRCGGGGKGAYSIVFGRHPEGTDYSIKPEVPVNVLEDFDSIWWPPDWELAWNGESPPPSPLASTPTGARGSPPEEVPDELKVTIAVLSKDELRAQRKGMLVGGPVAERTSKLDQAIKAYLDKVDPAIDGEGGSNPTYRVANALVWGFALNRKDALFFMRYYNRKCQGPWSEEELEHKVDNALQETTRKRVRGYLLREMRIAHARQVRYNWQLTAEERRAEEDAFEKRKPSRNVPRRVDEAAAEGEESSSEHRSKASVWVDKKPEELESGFPPVLIPGWLYQGRRMMVTGKPIMGKGLFLLQMDYCLATGTPFLNKKLGEPQKVYHIDFELMEAAIRERVWKMCEHFSRGNNRERDRLWELVNRNLTVRPMIDGEQPGQVQEFLSRLSERVRELGAVLTTLDPLWRICPSEMDEEKLRGFLEALGSFTRHSGTSQAYAQHQTKGDQRIKDVIDRFSGRNELTRDCATMVALTEMDSMGHVQVDIRTNDFAQPAPFIIKLQYPVFELNFDLKPRVMSLGGKATADWHNVLEIISPDPNKPTSRDKFVVTAKEQLDLGRDNALRQLRILVGEGKVGEVLLPGESRGARPKGYYQIPNETTH
jgi:hypothetical protein